MRRVTQICVGVAPSSPPHRPAGGCPGARRTESQDRMDRHHHAVRMVNQALRADLRRRQKALGSARAALPEPPSPTNATVSPRPMCQDIGEPSSSGSDAS